VTITGCTFTENTATVGGGAIFSEGAEIAINASTFIANTTPGFGGALFTNEAVNPTKSADTLITNSVLARNTAQGGGAWATLASSVTSINCTIVGNTSSDETLGGAFFNNAADTEVINAIIWYNSSEWVANLDGSFTEIRWSNVGGGDPGPDNIAAEPRFVNRSNDNYRLLPDSPSIDAGCTECATEEDILGTERQFDGVDQGAFESTKKAPAAPQCHGNDEAPSSAMPDPASALLLAALILAARRK
jgi:predicted outer membrane repeat protein